VIISTMLSTYPRVAIAVVALMIRLALGYIFYGSCDIDNIAQIIGFVLSNDLPGFHWWNYFPSISIYLWFAGFLAAMTPLPFAFCLKLIPMLSDVMVAVLIFEIVKKYQPERAFICGLLYATCPVPLMVTSIHGQWDAVFILFLIISFYVRDFFADSFFKFFIFGILFGCSILVKPISAGFLFFFFTPRVGIMREVGRLGIVLGVIGGAVVALGLSGFAIIKYLRLDLMGLVKLAIQLVFNWKVFFVGGALVSVLLFAWFIRTQWSCYTASTRHYLLCQLASIIGLKLVIATSFVVFVLLGFNIFKLCDTILRYCNHGVQLFGLPLAFPFNHKPFIILLKNRIWLMGVMGLLSLFYYQRRINVFEALCFSFALIVGFSGLCPNYMMWVMPFIFICQFYRAAGFFTLTSTVFYLFFYSNHFSEPWSHMYSMCFGTIASCDWLVAPAWLTTQSLVPINRMIGNYLIPLSCWVVMWCVVQRLFRRVRRLERVQEASKLPAFQFFKNSYLALMLMTTVGIAIVMLVYRSVDIPGLFQQAFAERIFYYPSELVGNYLVPLYGASSAWCNIIWLFCVATFLWLLVVWQQRINHVKGE
jgi:hypothetical protein